MRDPRLLERAIRRIAEQRIYEAMKAGAFDDLPGLGKPIPDIDEPYDPLWWIRKWLRRESLQEAGGGDSARRYRQLAAVEEIRLSRQSGRDAG